MCDATYPPSTSSQPPTNLHLSLSVGNNSESQRIVRNDAATDDGIVLLRGAAGWARKSQESCPARDGQSLRTQASSEPMASGSTTSVELERFYETSRKSASGGHVFRPDDGEVSEFVVGAQAHYGSGYGQNRAKRIIVEPMAAYATSRISCPRAGPGTSPRKPATASFMEPQEANMCRSAEEQDSAAVHRSVGLHQQIASAVPARTAHNLVEISMFADDPIDKKASRRPNENRARRGQKIVDDAVKNRNKQKISNMELVSLPCQSAHVVPGINAGKKLVKDSNLKHPLQAVDDPETCSTEPTFLTEGNASTKLTSRPKQAIGDRSERLLSQIGPLKADKGPLKTAPSKAAGTAAARVRCAKTLTAKARLGYNPSTSEALEVASPSRCTKMSSVDGAAWTRVTEPPVGKSGLEGSEAREPVLCRSLPQSSIVSAAITSQSAAQPPIPHRKTATRSEPKRKPSDGTVPSTKKPRKELPPAKTKLLLKAQKDAGELLSLRRGKFVLPPHRMRREQLEKSTIRRPASHEGVQELDISVSKNQSANDTHHDQIRLFSTGKDKNLPTRALDTGKSKCEQTTGVAVKLTETPTQDQILADKLNYRPKKSAENADLGGREQVVNIANGGQKMIRSLGRTTIRPVRVVTSENFPSKIPFADLSTPERRPLTMTKLTGCSNHTLDSPGSTLMQEPASITAAPSEDDDISLHVDPHASGPWRHYEDDLQSLFDSLDTGSYRLSSSFSRSTLRASDKGSASERAKISETVNMIWKMILKDASQTWPSEKADEAEVTEDGIRSDQGSIALIYGNSELCPISVGGRGSAGNVYPPAEKSSAVPAEEVVKTAGVSCSTIAVKAVEASGKPADVTDMLGDEESVFEVPLAANPRTVPPPEEDRSDLVVLHLPDDNDNTKTMVTSPLMKSAADDVKTSAGFVAQLGYVAMVARYIREAISAILDGGDELYHLLSVTKQRVRNVVKELQRLLPDSPDTRWLARYLKEHDLITLRTMAVLRSIDLRFMCGFDVDTVPYLEESEVHDTKISTQLEPVGTECQQIGVNIHVIKSTRHCQEPLALETDFSLTKEHSRPSYTDNPCTNTKFIGLERNSPAQACGPPERRVSQTCYEDGMDPRSLSDGSLAAPPNQLSQFSEENAHDVRAATRMETFCDLYAAALADSSGPRNEASTGKAHKASGPQADRCVIQLNFSETQDNHGEIPVTAKWASVSSSGVPVDPGEPGNPGGAPFNLSGVPVYGETVSVYPATVPVHFRRTHIGPGMPVCAREPMVTSSRMRINPCEPDAPLNVIANTEGSPFVHGTTLINVNQCLHRFECRYEDAGKIPTNAGEMHMNSGGVSTNYSGVAINGGNRSFNYSEVSLNSTESPTEAGVSAKSVAMTIDSSGIPINSSGIPNNSSGIPINFSGIPINSNGISIESSDSADSKSLLNELLAVNNGRNPHSHPVARPNSPTTNLIPSTTNIKRSPTAIEHYTANSSDTSRRFVGPSRYQIGEDGHSNSAKEPCLLSAAPPNGPNGAQPVRNMERVPESETRSIPPVPSLPDTSATFAPYLVQQTGKYMSQDVKSPTDIPDRPQWQASGLDTTYRVSVPTVVVECVPPQRPFVTNASAKDAQLSLEEQTRIEIEHRKYTDHKIRQTTSDIDRQLAQLHLRANAVTRFEQAMCEFYGALETPPAEKRCQQEAIQHVRLCAWGELQVQEMQKQLYELQKKIVVADLEMKYEDVRRVSAGLSKRELRRRKNDLDALQMQHLKQRNLIDQRIQVFREQASARLHELPDSWKPSWSPKAGASRLTLREVDYKIELDWEFLNSWFDVVGTQRRRDLISGVA
ncbi:hypothetical protein BIW11_14260 [Tropilaelaps mercedesae]|uniref:Uncharacterized protein n=1 Tax=Tropilaelaps mercedesae TaxID=418985 RepID=A0A1V9WYK9_9ACAR|nr:hypothetical protein BIW11_14260 [Tropilaelaps mercedesae]